MSIEESLDRIASNLALLTGAVATLAESVNGTYEKGKPIYGQTGDSAAPKATTTKGGKKPAGTSASAASSSSDAPASAGSQQQAAADASGSSSTPSEKTSSPSKDELDFFGEDPKPEEKPKKVKAATLDDVRNALVEVQTALKHKDHAIELLSKFTTGGKKALSELPEDKYGALIAAAAATVKAGKVTV